MKIITALLLLATLTGLSQFDGSATFALSQDSIPPRQRYQFKLASIGSSTGRQWSTLVIHPTKIRSGNEILLPVGFNENTIRVSSGERLLQVNEDYGFIPNVNRVRILDEDALTSQYPLKIVYERLILGSKP